MPVGESRGSGGEDGVGPHKPPVGGHRRHSLA